MAQVCGIDPRTCDQSAAPADADGSSQAPAVAPGASFVTDPNFLALLANLQQDVADALDKWRALSADSIFPYLPPGVLQTYNADGKDLVDAEKAFDAAWGALQAGRGDVGSFESVYDDYTLRFGALSQTNDRIEALIQIDVIDVLLVFLNVIKGMITRILALRLSKQLAWLIARLEQAESDVKDVKWKRRINVVVSTATLLIAPEEELGRMAVSFGAIAIHVVVDDSLGSSSSKSTIVFVGGDGADIVGGLSEHASEVIEHLGEGGKKFIGAAAGFATYEIDTNEIDELKKKVEEINADVASLKKELDDLTKGVLPLLPELISLDGTVNRLNKAIDDAMTITNDALKNYGAIKVAIQSAA